MKLLGFVGVVTVALAACGDDGSASGNPYDNDARCPYSSTSGVRLSRYLPDQQRCIYFCNPQLDDAGHPRSVLSCDGRCIPVDTVEHCGSCTRSCSGSTPYCDLSTTEACVATPPR